MLLQRINAINVWFNMISPYFIHSIGDFLKNSVQPWCYVVTMTIVIACKHWAGQNVLTLYFLSRQDRILCHLCTGKVVLAKISIKNNVYVALTKLPRTKPKNALQ